MARFRFGHTDLNAHLFRTGRVGSPICECGQDEEDNYHFLLTCRLYDSQRQAMIHNLENLMPFGTEISLNLLLGGPDFKETDKLYEAVAKEVGVFNWSSIRPNL